jgi:hypothetical protein
MDYGHGALLGPVIQNRWGLRKGGERGFVKYLQRKITLGHCLIISICLVWFFKEAMWFLLAASRFIFQISDPTGRAGRAGQGLRWRGAIGELWGWGLVGKRSTNSL